MPTHKYPPYQPPIPLEVGGAYFPERSYILIMDEYKERLHRQVERDFTYHPPKGDQTERYAALREKAKELAHLIIDLTPLSPEQEQARMLLNLAVMSANAGIARNE